MKNLLLLAVCLSSCFCLSAQESFEEYKKRVQQDFLQMKEQQTADFENYRRRVNLEFAEYEVKSLRGLIVRSISVEISVFLFETVSCGKRRKGVHYHI